MSTDMNNISELGNYNILQHINPEGLSKTYKVKHKYTDEIFAMKVVFAKDVKTIELLESTFKRLAQGITKLNNSNLIQFKEFFVEEIAAKKCFVLVSEFFAGMELQSYVSKLSPSDLSYEERIEILTKVCGAVRDAHKTTYKDNHGVELEGFPHGAITPWNIMINDKKEIRLLDFKLASRYTLSEEKLSIDQSASPDFRETVGEPISKSNDITQIGYLINYIFSTDKDYHNYTLGQKSLLEIGSSLSTSNLGKHRKKITELVYRCTRKNTEEQFSSVDEVLKYLEHGPKVANANRLSTKKKWTIAATILFMFGTLNFFFIKNFQPKVEDLSESRGAIIKTDKANSGVVEIGEYYAYMVGNEAYKHMKDLARPHDDVKKFSDILVSEYGFKPENIVKKFDATRDDIYDGFEQVASKVKENDNLLIFYAGHGQLDQETGYWIPVEGHESSRRNWIGNSEIKKFLTSIVAKNVLVVSDACFGGSLLRNASTYQPDDKVISKKKSRIALTSGSMESVPDHSIFIDQLFWYLENNQDTLVYTSNIFAGIREGIVSNTTNDPGYGPIRDSGHQGGDFFFVKKPPLVQ